MIYTIKKYQFLFKSIPSPSIWKFFKYKYKRNGVFQPFLLELFY